MSFSELSKYIYDILNFPLVTINKIPISLASILIFIVVALSFILLARFISRVLFDRAFKRFQIKPSLQFTLTRVTEYTLIIIGFIVAFQLIGIDLSGLAVIFGLLSVGIGFGLQNVTSNFVAGLILLFEQPIKVGDRVTVGEIEGDVQEINMRSTTIKSLNNISIIVPNSEFISSRVINWSHGDPKIRLDIDVGVSYQSDLDNVINSLRQVADENPEILRTPEPEVLLREFGDSSWNMHLRIWLGDPKRHHYVRSDINCAIVRKFRQNGIEIPYPQRDLHVRSPLPVPFTDRIRIE